MTGYEMVLINFLVWTILAGICLGIVFLTWRAICAGFKSLIHKYKKNRRLQVQKGFHLQRVK